MNHTIIVIRRHWLPLLALNSLLVAATFYLVSNAEKFSPPVWKANAQLDIPVKGDKLQADLGTLGNFSEGMTGFSKEVNPLETQSAILTSDAVMEQVLALDPEKSLYSDLESYKELFEVTPRAQTTMMLLNVQASSPELALSRVRTLVETYQQRLNELRHQEAKTQEQFANKELEKAQKDLVRAQNNLSKFRQSTGIINPDAQTQELIRAIQALKTQQSQVIAQVKANEAEAKIAAQIGITPPQAVNSLRLAENTDYQNIRDQVSQAETELAQARSIFTDETPQVQSLLLKRDELQSELNQRVSRVIPGGAAGNVDTTLGNTGERLKMIGELIKSEIEAKGLEQQASEIQNQLNQFTTEINLISKNQGQLLELERQYNIAEGVYKGIVAKVSQTKLNVFESYPHVQLIDGPSLNSEPKTASRRLIAFGAILASFFGSLSLTFLLESRNPLLSPKDLQQTPFPLVVSLPRLKPINLKIGLEAQAEREFQRLASIFSSLILENKRLMVTSASFGEGKTTVTLGLALALIKLGFRVLVVDGDLRQTELSRRLGYSHRKREQRPQETLVPIYPGFDLMLAPLIQPAKIGEFVARGDFERRLNQIQQSGNYDYVLIDSAPVSLAFETSLMSGLAHNIMFVVRPGISNRYSVMDSLDQLKQHNAQIRSLVLNGVETPAQSYRYYGSKPELVEAEV